MRPHVTHDTVAAQYADDVDAAWQTWAPALRRCERLLAAEQWRTGVDGEVIAEQLRRAQYRAHATSQLAAGSRPPEGAEERHAALLATLEMCRDALGVIAVRAELEELDDETIELGYEAVRSTREAFVAAQSALVLPTRAHQLAAAPASAAKQPWLIDTTTPPGEPAAAGASSSRWMIGIWSVVAASSALFAVLLTDLLGAR